MKILFIWLIVKNAPYGDKTKDRIIEYCLKNTEILLNQNSKIIVVACNTATTNAIKVLRDKVHYSFYRYRTPQ